MRKPRDFPSLHDPVVALCVLALVGLGLAITYGLLNPPPSRPAALPPAQASALSHARTLEFPPPSSNVFALAVGLTHVDPAFYRGWSGACPGSDVDVSIFAEMCATEDVPHWILRNDEATLRGITARAKTAVQSLAPDGLLILYFSGHGGQLREAVAGSEPDGQDETICLWDGPLRDDEVWTLLQQIPAGIRVWMITDSCNSGTNYRGVHDYASGIAARATREGRDPSAVSLLHWGGCGDGESSWGSAQGGHVTTALVDAWDRGQSYATWFEGAARVTPKTQVPTCAIVGEADVWRHRPAFQ